VLPTRTSAAMQTYRGEGWLRGASFYHALGHGVDRGASVVLTAYGTPPVVT
jgi:hypothetical protein